MIQVMRRVALMAVLMPVAACGALIGQAAPGVAAKYDGAYVGPFALRKEVSSLDCPFTDDGLATMTIRQGRATIDVNQGGLLSGTPDLAGQLTLISSGTRQVILNGRIDRGTFTIIGGAPPCFYQAQLTRR